MPPEPGGSYGAAPGVWDANLTMDPIEKKDDRRNEFADWESHERLLSFVRDARAETFEKGEQERLLQIQADFTKDGEKGKRVRKLAPEDHR